MTQPENTSEKSVILRAHDTRAAEAYKQMLHHKLYSKYGSLLTKLVVVYTVKQISHLTLSVYLII